VPLSVGERVSENVRFVELAKNGMAAIGRQSDKLISLFKMPTTRMLRRFSARAKTRAGECTSTLFEGQPGRAAQMFPASEAIVHRSRAIRTGALVLQNLDASTIRPRLQH